MFPDDRPPDGPLVRFVDVQKTYDGEALVIEGLNLEVSAGEFLTLLGPSGSGKTTCLMMLAGFETPTGGDILLSGRSINRVPPHKRELGVVFQNYALFPHMTVYENLAFPLRVRHIARGEIEAKVHRALEMVELAGLGNRRPGQLSGGQQQRVALARALVFEPQLVLMDEPLGALDKQLREQLQLEIRHIHERLGVTVIYVTHDQGEALTMSDRIAVFNKGIIQQLAAPSELYEQPQNSFVANFIGENNRLQGRVRERNGRFCVVELDSGATVHALAVQVDGSGSETCLSIRPERVEINPPANADVPNAFDAQIAEMIYHGDHIRLRVSVCGTDRFVVKVPNAPDRSGLRVGDTVRVAWRAEDCRALDPVRSESAG